MQTNTTRLLEEMKTLRVACAVAASGSSAQAAADLHVSQSSIVRAVQALERALGQTLFYRSARGMHPTRQAEPLLARCDRAWQQLAVISQRKGGAGPARAWTTERFAMGLGIRHMQVMQALSDTGSEPASARQLGISQSAVHQTLVKLEHLSGAALYARSRQNGLRITDAGTRVLRAIKLCVSELAQAAEVLATMGGEVRGRITIGTLPFSVGPMLPQAIDRMLEAYPGIKVRVIDGTYDMLMQQLRDADIDLMIGALRAPFDAPGLRQEPLFDDPLAVVARASHPLARRKKLNWSALETAQWIMPMPGTPAQAVFERVLQSGGLPLPTVELQVNSALMMQSLLMQGERLAMMSPRQIRAELQAGLLVTLPLPLPDAVRSIGLVYRENFLPTDSMKMLLNSCRSIAEEISKETPLISKTHS